MKKPLLSLLLWWAALSLSVCSAQSIIDVQLLDQINSWAEQSASSLKFTQAKSCETIQEMLKKYAKEQPRRMYDLNGWLMLYKSSVIKSMAVEEAVMEDDSFDFDTIDSSSTDYSTTNIQKAWVDEPEIIKTDWKYFYYYNSKTDKISIVQSPLDLDSAKLDPNKVKIVKEIAIPQWLSNVELFIQNERLTLIW